MQLLERVGSRSRTARFDPPRIRVCDERSERDSVCSRNTVQRMASMREVSEDLLTSPPRLFRCKRPDFPQYYSAITSEPCVVRSHAARLYPQREAGQSAIVDLKRFALRLGLFAGEQPPMKACMMRLLEWEAESPAVTGRAYKDGATRAWPMLSRVNPIDRSPGVRLMTVCPVARSLPSQRAHVR